MGGMEAGEGTGGQGLLPDCCALIDFSCLHLAKASGLLPVSVGLSEMAVIISKLAPSPNPSISDIKFLPLASNLRFTAHHHDGLSAACLNLLSCFGGQPLFPVASCRLSVHLSLSSPTQLGALPFPSSFPP